MSAIAGKAVAEKEERRRQQCEVAHIFREYGRCYIDQYSPHFFQQKVMMEIEKCRTSYFGGHIGKCDNCGKEEISYNSCRNRHCPKCQTFKKEKWLEDRKSELLPTSYFHTVFTLPHDLNPLARFNGKVIYDLLFKAASDTLLEFGADKKHLGGRIGFFGILHTWDQRINYHIHLHVIIPAGALSFDRKNWIRTRYRNYLFPVKALSRKFRGKFMAHLQQAYEKGELKFPEATDLKENREDFKKLLLQLWKRDWVIYSKPPFGGPEAVIEYLGRYTHRVAISNHRILKMDDGKVTFKYRDRSDGDKEKVTTIESMEFIRRFLHHVLPPQFMKIRHYGILSNRTKSDRVALCRLLINSTKKIPKRKEESPEEMMLRVTGIDITLCSSCKKGKIILIGEVPARYGRKRAPPR